ncbi:hypothetical protein ccbrp13_33240 [Ktedonobacteria bacterium brp13]|nr:hypothetical protein ccbrp13_33240 [Ktedonobacteria bacterium brp13]
MNVFGAIQTEIDMNGVNLDGIAPSLIHQSTVGLNAMLNMYTTRIEPLYYLKSVLIKGGG